MFNAGEKSGYIAFENIIFSPAAFCQLRTAEDVPHGGVGSAPGPAGEGFINKPLFKYRLYYPHKGMMKNAVTENRGGNEPPFWITDPELPERKGPIGFLPQVFDDGEQSILKAGLERENLVPVALAPGGGIAAIDIFKINEAVPEAVHGRSHIPYASAPRKSGMDGIRPRSVSGTPTNRPCLSMFSPRLRGEGIWLLFPSALDSAATLPRPP